MPPEFNPPDEDSAESNQTEIDDFLEEQPPQKNAVSCWMALILIIIAACLLMRVLCFNLSVFNFDPIPLH